MTANHHTSVKITVRATFILYPKLKSVIGSRYKYDDVGQSIFLKNALLMNVKNITYICLISLISL